MQPMLTSSFRQKTHVLSETKLWAFLDVGYEQHLPDEFEEGRASTLQLMTDFRNFRQAQSQGLQKIVISAGTGRTEPITATSTLQRRPLIPLTSWLRKEKSFKGSLSPDVGKLRSVVEDLDESRTSLSSAANASTQPIPAGTALQRQPHIPLKPWLCRESSFKGTLSPTRGKLENVVEALDETWTSLSFSSRDNEDNKEEDIASALTVKVHIC